MLVSKLDARVQVLIMGMCGMVGRHLEGEYALGKAQSLPF